MKIVIAGGSGFLGQRLVGAYRRDGHEVTVLTRRPHGSSDVQWDPDAGAGPWVSLVDRADIVINLSGENLGSSRWTPARKTALVNSRVTATRGLATAILRSASPPQVFLSASGVGYYGTDGNAALTEASQPGDDFLAIICRKWETEATAAAAATRVVLLRTALVLARDGGALPKIALPFRFGAGGRLGSGAQAMSWIHVDDYVAMTRWAASNAQVHGPLNVSAPGAVSNATFTRTLARALHRPALFTVPGLALRSVLGREMADSMLLGGQHAIPAKALQLGFRFTFPDLESALRDIFQ